MAVSPTVSLNNGVAMPRVGFGTWQVDQRVIELALAAGYRSIDTASMYGNEPDVARAIAKSGIPRNELFVTTKVWDDAHGYDRTLRSFEESRRRLALDLVDLYLIHWPAPGQDRYIETWRALEWLLAEGSVRAIGVSNFEPAHLDRLARETDTVPAVNQIKLNPYQPQRELRDYHSERRIATEAWAPLGRGEVLGDPVVAELAQRYGRTPAQIVLRWSIQHDIVAIPRSSNPSRIEENLDVFGFELDARAMERIDALSHGA